MPLVPSLQRKRKRENREAIWGVVRVYGGGLAAIFGVLLVIGWLRGDWTMAPRGILWMVEYTLGMKPE